MKYYDTIYTNENGEEKRCTFFSLTEAKNYIKTHEGAKGYITNIHANGDWEPCGEIKIKGCNAIQMSNEKNKNYR